MTDFERQLLALRPHIYRFARSLCKDTTRAEDITQTTLMNAWAARDSFVPGSNMKAWTFTIARNLFLTEERTAKRRARLDERAPDILSVAPPSQHYHMVLQDIDHALSQLPKAHQEALLRIAVMGDSYDDVAQEMGCPAGTVKSRVSRGRGALVNAIDGSPEPEKRIPLPPEFVIPAELLRAPPSLDDLIRSMVGLMELEARGHRLRESKTTLKYEPV